VRKLLLTLIALAAAAAAPIALARSDGIYNSGANSVGDTQGIDNPKTSALPGPPTLTFIANSTIAQSNASTITSTATANIGTASPTRRVIVTLMHAWHQ
jgi:hypothetical protein